MPTFSQKMGKNVPKDTETLQWTLPHGSFYPTFPYLLIVLKRTFFLIFKVMGLIHALFFT